MDSLRVFRNGSQSSTAVPLAELVPSDVLVALYFGAEWCDECQEFISKLVSFYEGANQDSKQVEIVFVSSDESSKHAGEYMKQEHGNWLAVPFEEADGLKQKFHICARKEMASLGINDRADGLPAVVLVSRGGEVLSITGKDDIQNQNPTMVIQKWKVAFPSANPQNPNADSGKQSDTSLFCKRGEKC